MVSSSVPGGALELTFLKRTAAAFLRTLMLEDVELSLVLVGDREIQRLNRRWRKKNKATDVLSFPMGRPLLGDVVISLPTARRAAKEHGVSLRSELKLYLAHGLLHLLGFDHQRPSDRRRMALQEASLLGQAGMLTRTAR